MIDHSIVFVVLFSKSSLEEGSLEVSAEFVPRFSLFLFLLTTKIFDALVILKGENRC